MSDPTSTTPAPDGDQAPENLRDFANRQRAEAETARIEAETLRAQNRALTFQAAGVDLESPIGKLFDKAYEGELTVDAVKTGWAEVAPQSAPAAPPAEPVEDGPTPEELASAQARAALSTGGTPPGEEPSVDPWAGALGDFREARARGVPVENAQAQALSRVFQAAHDGDQRVLE